MKFNKTLFVLASVLMFTTQCEFVNDDHLESPNSLPPSAVNPDFLLNQIQLEARNIYRAAASVGGEMTRMTYMFGDTYANAFSPNSFNGIYGNAYNDQFIDTENLLAITDENGFLIHSGIAKILKGYSLLALVDMFGDVPYSEALDPTNLNPGLDSGADVYAAAVALLDAGIADLAAGEAASSPVPTNDFFYPGEDDLDDKVEAWTKAAGTMKLKAFLNTGDAAGANALIADAGNSLITADGEDFLFAYSTNEVDPDSRHPSYAGNYIDNTGAGDYMAVSYMNMLLNDKDDMDPRMRYYFFRQTTQDTDDVNENTCINAFAPSHFDADDPFCLLGDGWWGRDHLIDDGIPPDSELRTTWGVYPAGGVFDSSTGGSADRGDGEGGEGIDPILMHWYTHFMIAEAQLRFNNDEAAAKTFLDQGTRLSFEYIEDFGSGQASGSAFAIDIAAIDTTYDAEVDAHWTGAANKLQTIAREYYFALFPNGYEAYNLMRRTGYPDRSDNLQPARTPNPGNWYRSVLYPANMVERNSTVDQKANADILQGPFWDPDKGSTKFNF